jgi:L-2-hydroxyglutarate oxidase LhgO
MTCGFADYAAVTRKYAEIVMSANGSVLRETDVVGIVRSEEDVVVQTKRGDYK